MKGRFNFVPSYAFFVISGQLPPKGRGEWRY